LTRLKNIFPGFALKEKVFNPSNYEINLKYIYKSISALQYTARLSTMSTKTNLLLLLTEMIALFSENNIESINILGWKKVHILVMVHCIVLLIK
jgi:hypothetical protein